MLHLNFSHARGLFDPFLARKLTVIGVGAVGGFVVANAAKAGARDITVYDHDVVDSHNVPMSIYRQDDVGHLKVSRLYDIVKEQSGIELKCVPGEYAGELLKGSVIVCVDTVKARRMILEAVCKSGVVDALIDTRVAEKYLSVHMIDPRSDAMLKSYEKLFPPTPAVPQTCGRHGFITVSQIAAATAVEFLTEAWASRTVERHFSVLVSGLDQLVMKEAPEDGLPEEEGGGDDGEV